MEEKLLTRDAFREGVFARDNHKCVFCDAPAVDAHHILERRLFTGDQLGGYFLSNGASVCSEHHLQCEMTTISVEAVREACGITKPTIPDHFYDDHFYDKWGNCILTYGMRMMGELFFDESVQKILKAGGVLGDFTEYVKQQRTFHMPSSPGVHDDDKALRNMDSYVGKRVILTKKMDGENTAMYPRYIHARSIDGRSHPSRDWVKQFHSTIAYNIPEGFRIYGENVYAKHSIGYTNLETYFYGFHVWDRLTCLSWDETLEYFELIGITPVKVLYRGIYDEKAIKAEIAKLDLTKNEGVFMRKARAFTYAEYRSCTCKWVRSGHVQTNKHWMYGQRVIPNALKSKEDQYPDWVTAVIEGKHE